MLLFHCYSTLYSLLNIEAFDPKLIYWKQRERQLPSIIGKHSEYTLEARLEGQGFEEEFSGPSLT